MQVARALVNRRGSSRPQGICNKRIVARLAPESSEKSEWDFVAAKWRRWYTRASAPRLLLPMSFSLLLSPVSTIVEISIVGPMAFAVLLQRWQLQCRLRSVYCSLRRCWALSVPGCSWAHWYRRGPRQTKCCSRNACYLQYTSFRPLAPRPTVSKALPRFPVLSDTCDLQREWRQGPSCRVADGGHKTANAIKSQSHAKNVAKPKSR